MSEPDPAAMVEALEVALCGFDTASAELRRLLEEWATTYDRIRAASESERATLLEQLSQLELQQDELSEDCFDRYEEIVHAQIAASLVVERLLGARVPPAPIQLDAYRGRMKAKRPPGGA